MTWQLHDPDLHLEDEWEEVPDPEWVGTDSVLAVAIAEAWAESNEEGGCYADGHPDGDPVKVCSPAGTVYTVAIWTDWSPTFVGRVVE